MCEVDAPSKYENHTLTCRALKSCTACISTTADCVWCGSSCSWRECAPDSGVATLNSLSGTNPGVSPFPKTKAVAATLDQCQEAGYQAVAKEWCAKLHTCHACSAHAGCTWQMDKTAKCKEASKRKKSSGNLTDEPGTKIPT